MVQLSKFSHSYYEHSVTHYARHILFRQEAFDPPARGFGEFTTCKSYTTPEDTACCAAVASIFVQQKPEIVLATAAAYRVTKLQVV